MCDQVMHGRRGTTKDYRVPTTAPGTNQVVGSSPARGGGELYAQNQKYWLTNHHTVSRTMNRNPRFPIRHVLRAVRVAPTLAS